jgi:hypothetical protein
MHKKKKEIPQERLDTLCEEIKSWLSIEKTQEHIAEVVYLFYDGPERREDFIAMDPSELEPKKTNQKEEEEEILELDMGDEEEAFQLDIGDEDFFQEPKRLKK